MYRKKYLKYIGVILFLLAALNSCFVLGDGGTTQTPTPTPTPTSALEPAVVLKNFNDVLSAACARARGTKDDKNADPSIEEYVCAGNISGTFHLKDQTINTINVPHLITYIFNNFNDNGTIYNSPNGQEITYYHDAMDENSDYMEGRVEISGNDVGYIEYTRGSPDANVNGTSIHW